MARFNDVALARYHTRKIEQDAELIACYDEYLKFKLRCERSSRALLRDWENIEDLYTQADLLRIAGVPSVEAASRVCRSIAWVIWDVYRCPNRGRLLEPFTDYLADLASKTSKTELSVSVITTNYDAMIETSFNRRGVPLSCPGFANARGGRLELSAQDLLQGVDRSKGVVHLLKLHGSVNWFDVGPEFVRSSMISDSSDKFSLAAGTCTIQYIRNDISTWLQSANTTKGLQVDPANMKPAILPPMLGKAAVGDLMSCQWRAAIEALSRARRVCVIGYSFPETDGFMTRMLAEGLHSNDECESILFIDNGTAGSVKARIRSMFTPVFLSKRCRLYGNDASVAIRELAIDGYEHVYQKASRLDD